MAFGANRVVHTKHKFLVQSRFGFAAFQKCSELSFESARIDYFEGGALIPIKTPGRLTFSDITLERGSSNNKEMFDWMLEVGNASKGGPSKMVGGKGLKSPDFKKEDVAVEQRDLDNTLMRDWRLTGAWPTKFVAGDWDNTVDEVVIEQLTLTYDWFDLGRGP